MKPIIITAYTNDAHIHDMFKIESAIKHLPKWFKDLPKSYSTSIGNEGRSLELPVSTMKNCPAVMDYLSRPLVVRIPYDLSFRCDDGELFWSAPSERLANMVSQFGTMQKIGFDIGHCKLATSWELVEPEGIPFLFTDAYYNNFSKNWRATQGVTNFRDQHHLAVNISVPNNQKQTEIKAGDPICYLMPLSERPVKVVSKLVSEQEFNWISEKRNKKFTFIDKWKKNRKLKKFLGVP